VRVNFATNSYWLFVPKEVAIALAPTALSSLGPEDQIFMNEFLGEDSNIATGNFQNAYDGAAGCGWRSGFNEKKFTFM